MRLYSLPIFSPCATWTLDLRETSISLMRRQKFLQNEVKGLCLFLVKLN